MKLTKAVVRQFESDQKEHGTKVALTNVIWLIAADLFRSVGVTRIRTEYAKRKR